MNETELQDGTPVERSANNRQAPTSKAKFILAVVVIMACFGAAFLGSYAANQSDMASITGFNQAKDDGNKVVTEGEQNIASVVEAVAPSIVSIITSDERSSGQYVFQAAGTGMIVSGNGYVMTNKHVVNGATSATVVTSDGKTFDDVRVVGSDPLNDVAFLKISGAKDLPIVTIGDSKTVRTGQSVIAIGNALGQYQNTVTSGIISGLGRPVIATTGFEFDESAESLADLLQTDAAINSGNSGGPLLNMQGQVIGINTAVAEGAQSIGFAIPIGATKGILKHLLETGEVKRAVIGLQYVSITPEIKAEYNLEINHGDLVTAISGDAIKPNGPAAKAGIKKDDIIVKVNDQEIGPGKSIATLIGEFRPGDRVQLMILRDGKRITKTLTLASY